MWMGWWTNMRRKLSTLLSQLKFLAAEPRRAINRAQKARQFDYFLLHGAAHAALRLAPLSLSPLILCAAITLSLREHLVARMDINAKAAQEVVDGRDLSPLVAAPPAANCSSRAAMRACIFTSNSLSMIDHHAVLVSHAKPLALRNAHEQPKTIFSATLSV
jgi:hypothetical protein